MSSTDFQISNQQSGKKLDWNILEDFFLLWYSIGFIWVDSTSFLVIEMINGRKLKTCLVLVLTSCNHSLFRGKNNATKAQICSLPLCSCTVWIKFKKNNKYCHAIIRDLKTCRNGHFRHGSYTQCRNIVFLSGGRFMRHYLAQKKRKRPLRWHIRKFDQINESSWETKRRNKVKCIRSSIE